MTTARIHIDTAEYCDAIQRASEVAKSVRELTHLRAIIAEGSLAFESMGRLRFKAKPSAQLTAWIEEKSK